MVSSLYYVGTNEYQIHHDNSWPIFNSDKQTADSREDVPQPKPQLDPREENKRLDLESPISGPGRRRNVAAVEEPDHTDLKVSITDREKHGTKTDTYIMYKICTDVSL